MNGLLPPSSSATRLTPLAAAAWIALPVATEPVNEIASTSGCSTSAWPTSLPVPCTTLNTPGGRPGIESDLGHQHGRHRRLLGRLEDDRVARRERGGDHREHCCRAVPRHDQADDADGLAHLRHVELARYRRDGALQLRRPSAEVLDPLHGELHDEPGVGAQQPGVEHVDLAEQLTALGDDRGHVAQDTLLGHRRLIAPATVLERSTCGASGTVHVVHVSGRRLGDDVARRWIDDVEGRAAARRDAFTVDDVAEESALDGGSSR